MRTTRGRDQGLTGPTRFNDGRRLGTGANPGLVPDFALNFINEALPAAVTFSRASNATQFDSLGRLVWAPANLIPQSSTTGAVVGTIGSGGAVPTGWSWSTPPAGITREVLAIDSDYIIVRMYGTSSSGSLAYPQITPLQPAVTSVPTEDYCGSMFVQVVGGDFTGLNAAAGKVNTQWLNSGSYVNEATPSAQATTTEARLTSAGVQVAATNSVRVSLNLTISPLATVDITLKIGKPQLERGLIGTPLAYNRTTGSAYYGPRFDYNPQTLQSLGLLVELSRTNLLPRSMGATSDWTANFSTVTNTGAVILGNVAHTLTATSIGSAQFCFPFSGVASFAVSTLHTSSIRVKRGNHPRVQFTVTNNIFLPAVADAYANYNFDTDTLVIGGSSLPAPTGVRFVCADGSVILTLTYTTGTAPTSGAGVILCPVDTDSAVRLAGTGTNGATVHFFAGQCEAGGFATSLIPTFGTAATRADDVASPGVAWYTTKNSTWLVDFALPPLQAGLFPAVFGVTDAGSANRVFVYGATEAGNAARAALRVDEATVNYINTTTPPSVAQPGKTTIVCSFADNNTRFCCNGGPITPDLTCNIPAAGVTPISRFGGLTSTNAAVYVRRFQYFPVNNLPDATLQALST